MFIKSVTKYLSIAFCYAILFFSPNYSIAQLKYSFERINSENGLPTNAIKGLQFDEKNRFLWVATESGIIRYNGHSFQNFGDISSNENLNGRIVFFERANNGTLFGKLSDQSVFKIKANKAVIDTNFKRINSQKDFISYKYNLPNLKVKDEFSQVEYSSFKIGSDIYFINYDFKYQQLRKITNGKIDSIATFNNGVQGFMIGKRFFLIQNNGTIFEVENGKEGKINFNSLVKLNFPKKNIFHQPVALKVFQNNPNKQVYIIQGTNLFELQFLNNIFSIKHISDQIPQLDLIRYFQIDDLTKTIYLGTDNRGVIILHPQHFRRVLPKTMVEGASASSYAQVQLSNGDIQINSGQLFGTKEDKSNSIFYRPSSTNTFISSDKKLYFTNSDGIIEYDLIKNEIINVTKSKFVNMNSFIEVDSSIYAINDYGVIMKNKFKNSHWKLVLKFIKTPSNFIVYQLAEVKNGEILAATTDGLYKYNISKNSFKLFFRDSNNNTFRSISDLGGYYIISTYGSGAYMYKEDTIKKMPLDKDGYYKYVHCFIEDDYGRIWSSTNKGLFMAPKQSLVNFWDVGPGKIIYKYFGKIDGIDVLEMNGGCTPCAIKLQNGEFSIPGIDGLIQFDPNTITDLNIIPKVYLDKISVNNLVFNKSILSDLPFKTAKISFKLGVSGMLSQENIRLEYNLDDNTFWNQVSLKDPVLNIENPGYGSHKIIVRSRSTYNPKWEVQQFNFKINYPWFLNPYMYFVYLIGTVGIILLYIRFKTLIYQRRQKILESEVESKTKSLNKINKLLIKRNQAKDHVIAIMNHDILTPLKYLHITAKNVAAISKEENVRNSINQIAKTSKELEYLTSNMLNWVKFDNLEALPAKQVIDLNAFVNDLLEYVKPFNQNDEVQILNNIKKNTVLDSWPDMLRILLYNLIINSIKSTSTGNIIIEFSFLGNKKILKVKDTGIGMNNSMVQYLISGNSEDGVEDLPKHKKGNGVGFQIIRNIIKLMKASIHIDSKEGVGTTISILFI